MSVSFTNLTTEELRSGFLLHSLFLKTAYFNRQLRVVLDGNCSQECLINPGFPHGLILDPAILECFPAINK